MKVRLFVLALVFGAAASLSVPARAQIGLYLNPVVTRVGMSPADTGPYALLGSGVTSRFFGGVDFGGYWDFFHADKFSAGVDVRETIVHADNAHLDTFSVAPRIATRRSFFHFVPYAQVAVGSGSSKPGDSLVHTTRLEYGIFGGLDMPINHHVDFRAIELGYGSVTPISNAAERGGCTTAPSTDPSNLGTPVTTCVSLPSASLFNLSTGLVFRFGK